MTSAVRRVEIVAELQASILRLQGFKTSKNPLLDVKLGPIQECFPEGSFPVAAVHEFVTENVESKTATAGFVSGLLSMLAPGNGTFLWISTSRTIFPPGLKTFGIQPDRCIFIDLKNEKDILWAIEEALKCSAVTAVIGELPELSFTASRRLQLAVETSNVTAFILSQNRKSKGTNACVSRWKIKSIPSIVVDNIPGIGFPAWEVELIRVRNGKPGNWNICWKNGSFYPVEEYSEQKNARSASLLSSDQPRKAG
jgi:protein ImuA